VPPPQLALLKWPNDVLVGRPSWPASCWKGWGRPWWWAWVNLAQAPQIEGARRWRFPLGPAPDRDSFASLASHFSNELALWRDYGLAALARRWQAVAHPPGTRLAVTDAAGGVLEGSLPGWTRGRCA
jgi:BirA family biotin operon repressor/biotin-[acetyl-CoA-carboxylase] ligase